MENTPVAIYQSLMSDLASYLSLSPVEVTGYGPPARVRSAAANAMAQGFLKKFIESSDKADSTALEIFHASNKKCKEWVHPSIRTDLSEEDHLLLGEFLKTMDDFFLVDLGQDAELSWANICENARSGPGSSVGATGQSFYAKHFSSRLTATSESLYRVYRADIALWPEFSNAEIIRQENYGSPRFVEGSNASFVPKTADVSRMISSEPIVNMYLQLGLGAIIEKRLNRFFNIDLEIQPSINRYMAKLGSTLGQHFDDRGFATIDLRSASDSISLGLLGYSIPAEWQSVILELRSPRTRIGGSWHDLNMVSTMGNGFTFPLQTAIFSCVASSCVSLSDQPRKGWSPALPDGKFSVFGDDIIIDSTVYHRCLRLLNLLGFTVNEDKSFGSGPFRESCGHDYFAGYNIRPVYLRKLKTDQDVAVIINLLFEWSTRTGIPVFRTIEHLWSLFKKKPPLVPFSENMDAGVRVPFSLVRQREPGKFRLARDENNSLIYRRYQPRATRVRIGEGNIFSPKGLKRLIYNPSGLLMAYLRGEIRSGTMTVRNNRGVPYDTKRAVCPNWDWQRQTIESKFFGLTFDKAQWNTVVEMHLIGLPKGPF